jgi:ribosomal protein S30
MPTHGSLSKAGKVRSQNKKSFREQLVGREKRKYYHRKKHSIPRINNRRKFEKLMKGEYIPIKNIKSRKNR